MADISNTKIEDFINNFEIAVDFQTPEDISPDTVIADIRQWDSLAALSVIVMFDMTYGKTITGHDIEKSHTISDLFSLLD